MFSPPQEEAILSVQKYPPSCHLDKNHSDLFVFKELQWFIVLHSGSKNVTTCMGIKLSHVHVCKKLTDMVTPRVLAGEWR